MAGFKILAVTCLVLAVAHGNPAVEGGEGGAKKHNGTGLVPGLLHAVGGTLQGVTQGVGNLVDGVGDVVGGVVGSLLGTGAGGAVDGLVDGVANLVKGLGNTTGNTVDTVGNLGQDKGNDGEAAITEGDGGLAGVLDALLNGVTKITGNAKSILEDLSKLKVPGTVDDVLNTVSGVTATVGEIVNALIPGAGTAVSNLVNGILKTVLCAVGSPGLLGDLVGDKRGGNKNTKDLPVVCSPDYGKDYGTKPYTGGNNAKDIIKFYGLDDLDKTINELIKKFKKEKGNDLSESEKALIKWFEDVEAFIKKNKGRFSNEDLAEVVVKLIIIFGGISNSAKEGSGKPLAKALIKYINQGIKRNIFGGKDFVEKKR